jgi:translation initiation factor 2B subunit (eIF-2B alpha/beta/delta family)
MSRIRQIAIAAILVGIVTLAAPVSAVMYGQSPNFKAAKIVEFADRAEQRVQDLIDLVYLNTTEIDNAGLLDELDGNVTLFNLGAANVTAAQSALEAENYEGAIANATQALQIFREVFQSIHFILNESGIQQGDIVDGQGLLVAMRRALERIERLRELLPEGADEAMEMLDNATNYLDLDAARLWLQAGNVTDTAHNLTQANHLISQVHHLLVAQAKQLNAWRINNYLRGINGARLRIRAKILDASNEGVDVNSVLQSMGYQNVTDFMQSLQNMTENAQGKINDIKDAIQDLREIGRTIRQMDRELTMEIIRYRGQHGNNGMGGGMGGNS